MMRRIAPLNADGQGKAALTDGFQSVAEELKRMNLPQRQHPTLGFVALILSLVMICTGLGTWQFVCLQQNEERTASIADRAAQPALLLPPIKEWIGFDPESWDFRHTSVTGTFRNNETILVFTNLADARGKEQGPGYWVVAPLVLNGGGVVWVNRGFVPEALRSAFADGGPPEIGEVTVSGILRRPETASMFTPGTDRANRVDWIFDTRRFAAISDTALTPVLPAYLDQDATAGGGLPQGGETRFDLPSHHFEYAMTWFGLAAVMLFSLGIWLFVRRRG